MGIFRGVTVGATLLLASHAGVQGATSDGVAKALDESELRACLFIEDDQLRLRCFDQATGRAEVTVANKPPAAVEQTDEGLRLFPTGSSAGLSYLDQRWELSPSSKRGTFVIRPYQPVYVLPVFYNAKPNNQPSSGNPANTVVGRSESLDNTESKFQLSLKTKLLENVFGDNGDVWFGYTQSSRWQVFNEDLSRPFRETNYEPEAIFTWRTSWSAFKDATGWEPRMLGVSFNHQSNGRALPLSRSWNRVMGIMAFERENSMIQIRPWVRVSEKSSEDDNPNITDFVGRGDVLFVHKSGGHEYSLLARHSLRGGDNSRGAVQFDWAFPLTRSLRGHVQAFSGYGESLIDFNYRSEYLGVGFSLVGWY